MPETEGVDAGHLGQGMRTEAWTHCLPGGHLATGTGFNRGPDYNDSGWMDGCTVTIALLYVYVENMVSLYYQQLNLQRCVVTFRYFRFISQMI